MAEYRINPAQAFLHYIAAYPKRPDRLTHDTAIQLRVMLPYSFLTVLKTVVGGMDGDYLRNAAGIWHHLQKLTTSVTPEDHMPSDYLDKGKRLVDFSYPVIEKAQNSVATAENFDERDLDEPANVAKVAEAQAALTQALALGDLIINAFNGLSVYLALNPDPVFLYCQFVEAASLFTRGGHLPSNDPRDIKICDLPLMPDDRHTLLMNEMMFVGEYLAKKDKIPDLQSYVKKAVDRCLAGVEQQQVKGHVWQVPSIEDNSLLDESIDILGLNPAVQRRLVDGGIRQIGQLVAKTYDRAYGGTLPPVGGVAEVDNVRDTLAIQGLYLGRNVGRWKAKQVMS